MKASIEFTKDDLFDKVFRLVKSDDVEPYRHNNMMRCICNDIAVQYYFDIDHLVVCDRKNYSGKTPINISNILTSYQAGRIVNAMNTKMGKFDATMDELGLLLDKI